MARSPSPENVTDLIAKPVAEFVPGPRYVSRYREKIRRAAKRGKSAHKTLGVPNVALNSPGEFLRKHTSAVPKRPEVHHEHYHKPGYQRKLPDWQPIKASEKNAHLSRTRVDFTKLNIDEATNLRPRKPRKYYVDDRHGTVHALKPSGLYPTYRNRKSYGQVPGKSSPQMGRSEPKPKSRNASPRLERKMKSKKYEDKHVKHATRSPRRYEDVRGKNKAKDARKPNKNRARRVSGSPKRNVKSPVRNRTRHAGKPEQKHRDEMKNNKEFKNSGEVEDVEKDEPEYSKKFERKQKVGKSNEDQSDENQDAKPDFHRDEDKSDRKYEGDVSKGETKSLNSNDSKLDKKSSRSDYSKEEIKSLHSDDSKAEIRSSRSDDSRAELKSLRSDDSRADLKSSGSGSLRRSVSHDDEVGSRGSVQQPRCRYVTEDEREELLYGMKKKWDEMMKKFQCLPFLTDTPPKAKRKSTMEKELLQLEKDIKIIERHPYIYVYSDSED